MPLQRIITDFGSDAAFGKIPQKLEEHYGISVPVSSAQKITEQHAQAMLDAHQENFNPEIPAKAGVDQLISELDGSYIPIVTTELPLTTEPSSEADESIDRRKTRKVFWKEARIAMSRTPEQSLPIFACTLGSANASGEELLHSAILAGLGEKTLVHGVGDGAPWINDQFELQFGEQGSYLIDFFHLCDYLAAASHTCAPHATNSWLETQKLRLKRNHLNALLNELECHLEPISLKDDDAPVRAAWRYIKNRPGQFDYKGAIAADLPIGSGEIESAHRYVIQERLKLPGCWWTVENAWAMLQLRVVRINGDWNDYWVNLNRRAA
ncbi:MAG: UPF0236 family protein [Leptolyngbyaceae cyanobacterium bins.302]|nr:UPF0236 family protein [Leptolyngbyaceae cyanobacterium bins.302]